MAKEANITEIMQTLQEAQQNKDLLNAVTTNVEKYVAQQKKGLEELEALINQAKTGKVAVKERRTYRGRKKKAESEEVANG